MFHIITLFKKHCQYNYTQKAEKYAKIIKKCKKVCTKKSLYAKIILYKDKKWLKRGKGGKKWW